MSHTLSLTRGAWEPLTREACLRRQGPSDLSVPPSPRPQNKAQLVA